jgi:hypothetical protein
MKTVVGDPAIARVVLATDGGDVGVPETARRRF